MVGGAADWRIADRRDLDVIMAIQDVVHALKPERREVMAERMAFSPQTCRMLDEGGRLSGYAFSFPYRLDDAPALDALLGTLPPDPDCFYVHDVALLPQARGQGAGRAYIDLVGAAARERGFRVLSLISVYGTWPLWQALGFETRAVPTMVDKLAGFGDTARYMVKALG